MAVAITTAMQNQIAQNYIAILGRNPDPAGFSFWVQTYADANGTPAALTSITNGFGNSAEFRGTYSSLTTSDAIALMYQNVLLRPADAGGLAYWTGIANALIAGGQTISNAYAQTGAQMIYTAAANGTSDSASIIARTSAAVSAGNSAPITTYTLTTNIDTWGNTGSGQQVFNAANATFTSLDTLTGGSATNDTLNVASTAAYSNPAGARVTGVEIVNLSLAAGGTVNSAASGNVFSGVRNLNITSSAGALTTTADATTAIAITNATPGGNALAVNGGSSVSVTQTGSAGATDTITIGATTAPTGAVTVNSAAAVNTTAGVVSSSAVAISGGSIVVVNETLTNTNTSGANANAGTQGAVGVTGTAITTAVTVTQSAGVAGTTNSAAVAAAANTNNAVAARTAVALGQVTISDAVNTAGTQATTRGTITSATLQNYANSTIASNVLDTLTLSNTTTTGISSGTLGLTYGLTTGGPTALTLNLGGSGSDGSLGAITDNSNVIATLNIALSGGTTRQVSFVDTALRTMNLSGTGVLRLDTMNTAVTSVTATGAAGLRTNLSGNGGLTSINFSGTSAANTLTLNAATQAYTGGTGVDIITIAADALQTITGGAGTDVLVLNAVGSTFTAANTVARVTGFETLGLDTGSSGTFNMNTLTGFSNVNIRGALAGATSITNAAAGTGLIIDAASTTTLGLALAGTTGASSTINVTLNGTSVAAASGGGTIGYSVLGANALTLADANGVGIGNVNIVANATVGGGAFTIDTLTDSALTSLNLSGTGSVNITNAISTNANSLTLVNNSTSSATTTLGGVTASANAMGGLNYSGTHDTTISTLTDNVLNLTIANANTATTAGTGVLTISAYSAAANTSLTVTGAVIMSSVTLGVGTAGAVIAGTNNAAMNILANGGGIKTITLGNGADGVQTGSANDVITLGTGANRVFAGAGADRVTVGAGTGFDNIVWTTAAAAGGGDSGTFAVPGANSISTSTFDIYTGLRAGDNLNVGTTTVTILTVQTPGTYATAGAAGANARLVNTIAAAVNDVSTAVLADNSITLVRGTWTSGTNTFVGSATGTDTLMALDTASNNAVQAYEAIILVGYVNTGTLTAGTAGVITL